MRAASNAPLYIGAFAWASLPAAANTSGMTARVTDFGVNLMVISDGTRWVPLGPQVLGRSAVAVPHTGDTAEFTLATIAVPANLMGLSGELRVTARYSFTGSTNTKTFRTRLGGTQFTAPGTATASQIGFVNQCLIMNRNSAALQLGVGDSSGLGGFSVSYTGTVDTTAAQNITITGQLASAGETITLEGYLVEVMP